jgi:hypothetical protein
MNVNKDSNRSRWAGRSCVLGLAVLTGLLPLSVGCLNPQFVNRTAGGLYPITPKGEPFLSVRVINDTEGFADLSIFWDDGLTENEYAIDQLDPQARDTGILLDWPVLRLSIGDLDAPYAPTIVITLPDGTTSRVPFGQPVLEGGVEFARGDTVIFYLIDNPQSPAFVTVSTGLIDATSQPSSYSRANPYETVQLVLALNGF